MEMRDMTTGTEESELYQELINQIELYHPSRDYTMLKKAYDLAHDAHKSQLRKSGEPYIIHPLKVAFILAELELDMESIVAGILHDVIEDTEHTYEDIERLFNKEVAALVDGVTKLGKLSYTTKEEIQAENYRKMFLAMAKDIRVILIKLADRLHNMRTLNYMTEAKQKEKAQETLDIYAPIAHRLGISKIRIEMEDLCFQYLNPKEHANLMEQIEQKKDEREKFIQSIVDDVEKTLVEAGIHGKIEGRIKHFFSIYKKMVKQNKELEEIYDLFAIRVIVDSVKDCYAVLGILHTMYTPMLGRFKDYIAMPKSNMYQSLHNTLMSQTGSPFEVQIRTWDMHRTSEYGIAAHWKYKEGQGNDGKNNGNEEAKLAWLRQILEWQKDMSDNKEYLDTIKLDLNVFTSQVYAFTPQGKVIQLPKSSTPIDFAYMIHSGVGNRMTGAKANGKIVPIDYEIQNGDIIDIITSLVTKGPSHDWLNIVKSSQAKNKIRQWFKKEKKEENVQRGKDAILLDIKRRNLDPQVLFRPEWLELVVQKYDFKSWEGLLASVGFGGLKEGQVVNRLKEEFLKEKRRNITKEDEIENFQKTIEATDPTKKKKEKRSKSGVKIDGVGDVAVRFSRCCGPIPGDEIIGFITRGRGVTIHTADCINVVNLPEHEKNRLIGVSWDGENTEGKSSYFAEIRVISNDRTGLLSEVSRLFADEAIDVRGFNIKITKDNLAIFDITLEIKTKEQLEKITNRVQNVKGVLKIERVKG
ncbi:MAG: bifunctional (p)ppGpp synthetase/guanosine-3',5'-bis(diphosphate) 3'-pyrophosphohydrolase [Bacillota bacterium]